VQLPGTAEGRGQPQPAVAEPIIVSVGTGGPLADLLGQPGQVRQPRPARRLALVEAGLRLQAASEPAPPG
jgi:hypothetical protein